MTRSAYRAVNRLLMQLCRANGVKIRLIFSDYEDALRLELRDAVGPRCRAAGDLFHYRKVRKQNVYLAMAVRCEAADEGCATGMKPLSKELTIPLSPLTRARGVEGTIMRLARAAHAARAPAGKAGRGRGAGACYCHCYKQKNFRNKNTVSFAPSCQGKGSHFRDSGF